MTTPSHRREKWNGDESATNGAKVDSHRHPILPFVPAIRIKHANMYQWCAVNESAFATHYPGNLMSLAKKH